MGNSQSNSINGEINKILQETPEASSIKDNSPLNIKFNDNSKPVAKYVSADTDKKKNSPRKNRNMRRMSPKSKGNMRRMSPTSSAHMHQGKLNVSGTHSATSPDGQINIGNMGDSATSSAAVPNGMEHSATSAMTTSPTSSEPIPNGVVVNSATSTDSYKNTLPNASKPSAIIEIDPSIFESSEVSPKLGGYTYYREVSENTDTQLNRDSQIMHKNSKIITLDSNIFETSEDQVEPGVESAQRKSDFNPEQFFKEMQSGGLYEPRNKEHKKGRVEKYLTPDDDDEGFDFAESTEGLDLDENEDTEDLKEKVKHLRMMVSRSKGKKSSKKSSKKSKRTTESSGGASESGSYESGSYGTGSYESGSYGTGSYESGTNESGSYGTGSYESGTNESATPNSVSEYLDTTSSISTSDVRLISMNKMRK